MAILLLTAIFAPLAGLFVLLIFRHYTKEAPGWATLPFPILSVLCMIPLIAGNQAFDAQTVSLPWIPSLGLNLTFLVDGLSLFFGLIVAGMGVLIVFYAIHYFGKKAKDQLSFFSYLLLFMFAMLGTVFSGNLLLLFVFWELTGIASFLLIGFLHDKEESRSGARMALLTTAFTGLLLLAGVVCLYLASGTLDLVTILSADISELPQGLTLTAFFLIMLGAFGKSAQFPFHFWLPNAMAAPTPVSAYLHSATMVKLGVFLVARTFPIFAELPDWNALLMIIGFTTFLIGAAFALLSNKLKAILAYSTVAQLGFLIGFYGISEAKGTHFDFVHILNHVFYKGCLFMVVGIIDHATHCKDIRELGGLRRKLPLLAVIATIGAAAMAGLPFTTGFISKEYMLKEKFVYWFSDEFLNWFPLTMVVIGSILKVAFSARLARNIFWGEVTEKVKNHFHHPGFWVQLPPLLLVIAAVFFGVFPGALDPFIDKLQVPDLHTFYKGDPGYVLKNWHGLTRELLTSLAIVVAGIALYLWANRVQWGFTTIPKYLRFDDAFNAFINWIPRGSKSLTAALRSDSPTDYLPIIGTTFAIVVGLAFGIGLMIPGEDGSGGVALASVAESPISLLGLVVAILTGAAALGVVLAPRWPTQVIALSVVGLLVTFYFVLMRAPDLAMTQILIEATALILILILLGRFPKSCQEGEDATRDHGPRKGLNLFIASAFGILMTLLTYTFAAIKDLETSAGQYYLDHTVKDAKGTNTVNTILVDFRGFDTFMEITVLLIATLGCIGLLMRKRRDPDHSPGGSGGACPAGARAQKHDPDPRVVNPAAEGSPDVT